MSRRAIGIVRVSVVGGRGGESFVSPTEQASRIRDACERDGLELVSTVEELDVSGGTPLASREGLRGAVEAIEAGEAEVLVAAYFDRLVRSLRVQEEVVQRVEAAGGRVMAVDIGQITGATASQWLSGTMLGAVHEYQRRSAGERIREAQARAVARGVVPWPSVPVGYERGSDGVLIPAALTTVETLTNAFEMRVNGATIRQVRAFLRSHGIDKSFHGVGSMLHDRLYLGEIHFGSLVNLQAHEPIIDRDLFERVQRVSVPRGRRAHSDRLLARLGVLRCGVCGARMSVGTQTQMRRGRRRRYPFYRCPPTGDCPSRQTIGAEIAESVVVDAVRQELANVEGTASVERDAQQAIAVADASQADLDAAIRAFSGVSDEPVAREKVADLRHRRDSLREEAHRLSRLSSAVVIRADADWDRLTLSEQRALIRATVERAVVEPGRGAGRIRVHLFGENPSRG